MPEGNRIKVLSPQLANLIAAGEVVERPASVVKELIENSIDAGAKNITVEIKNGGTTYIRVTDDGKGIPALDVKTAFLRHATSKISTESDLDCITTMGFRGEALAALSAVSKVDMYTRVKTSDSGWHICIEGGAVIAESETGCAVGTNIVVRDLFYNVPARSKFMKKDATEAARVEEVVTNASISHPEIAFKFIKDNRDSFETFGNDNLRDVMYAVVGKEVVDDMVRIATEFSGIQIGGFIAGPNTSRATRNMQGFFINGRPVRSKVLTAAVDEAYKGRLMVGRQPIYYIVMDMHPSRIDVNVHPAKLEVKFSNEREVFLALRNAVSAVLDSLDMQKAKLIEDARREEAEINASKLIGFGGGVKITSEYTASNKDDVAEKDKVAEGSFVRYHASYGDGFEIKAKSMPTSGYLYSPIEPDRPIGQDIIPEFGYLNEKDVKAVEDSIVVNDSIRIAGEIFDTYIIVEENENLWLIDKHAAHERQIYNQLKKDGIEGMSQYLFTPKMVVLARNEKQAVLDNTDEFRKIGFDIEDFGGASVIVRSAPNYVSENDIPAVVSELADKLLNNKEIRLDMLDGLLKSVSCKSAIKAGMVSQLPELKKLAVAVLSDPELQSCPHGRPTRVQITRQELEKMFKRIV